MNEEILEYDVEVDSDSETEQHTSDFFPNIWRNPQKVAQELQPYMQHYPPVVPEVDEYNVKKF